VSSLDRVDTVAVAANVDAIRRRIANAGGDGRVRLVAVTKGFGPDAVRAALAAGVVDIGENYAQELEEKAAACAGESPAPRWHFIGRIQRNKVRRVAGAVQLWQSVDRVELGREIATRCGAGTAVLVQVNVSAEPQKGGCEPSEVAGLVAALRAEGLDVRGLMAIGPDGPPEGARPGFRLLNSLACDLGVPERSMGMSADLDVAVEEGATMVRVGRAHFGPRR
jgi:pyridoxal phosphate enzyme (YggS family)